MEDHDLKDHFEERAAIMEFDGGLDRETAERLAREEVYGKPKKKKKRSKITKQTLMPNFWE